jgi:hypothetical protein
MPAMGASKTGGLREKGRSARPKTINPCAVASGVSAGVAKLKKTAAYKGHIYLDVPNY